MKNSFYLFGFITLFLISCETDDGGGTDGILGCTDPLAANFESTATADACNCIYDGFTAIGNPPATALRNVLIEEFTGEWCGWCVDGTYIIETLMENNPGRVFTTAIHQGDFLQTGLTQTLSEQFNASFYPSGVVDRKLGAISRELWAGRTSLGLNEVAKAGIAIETKLIDASNLEGVVHVDFKENLVGNAFNLVLYVTESGIAASAQQNYYSFLSGQRDHPYYSKNRVLGGSEFTHNFVLRKEVASFEISPKAIKGEGVFTRKFSLNIGGYQNENVEIIAMIVDGDLENMLNVAGVGVEKVYNW